MDANFPTTLIPAIEAFFEQDVAEPGADLYPDVFKSEFFPLQRKQELQWMIQQARAIKPKTIYEIGCDKGGSLYHWCKCLSPDTVIACEIRGIPYKHLFEEHFPDIDFVWLEGNSRALISKITQYFVDILFIDGDKGTFYEDFQLVLPYMLSNSIVFMHDIQDEVPGEAYQRVVDSAKYRTVSHIDLEDTRWALRRESHSIKVSSSYEGWLRHWRGTSCGVGAIYL